MDGDSDADGGADARAFERAFAAAYLVFHRRDRAREELSGASRAVLLHLSLSGPLSVGAAATHLGRAQSVVSEIVSQLQRHGWVERLDDPADRRRTLVWLTAEGRSRLEADRRVLSLDLVGAALQRLHADQRTAVVAGLQALVNAASPPPGKDQP